MTVERFSLHRILKGTAETISLSVYADGVIADPGETTVTITRADGTALVTAAATAGSGAVARTYALSAANTASLDLLTVTWTTANHGTQTTYVEIVGDHLFTLYEARTFDDNVLQSTTTYPQALLEETRARITDAFEDVCGVSFIPRYKLVTLSGNDDSLILLPDMKVTAIRSLETRASGGTTWTAYTSTQLADLFLDDAGSLIRESLGLFTLGRRNIRVGYEYGFTRPPLEIKRAALKLLTSVAGAVNSNLPERATSMSGEFGTFTLATPGLRGSHFGLPEVDEVLSRYDYRIPGIA